MDQVKNSEKSNDVELKKPIYNPDKSLHFIISIVESEWETIKPVETEWSDRTTIVLQPGWTDLILDKIWQQYPLECPFSFHGHKFFKRPGHPYLKFTGQCNECKASIKGEILEKPTAFPYSINIETFDTRSIKHSQSRQLRYSKRAEFREQAKYVKPLKLRHLQANDNLDDEGNFVRNGEKRPDLNSTAVISRLRHENKKKDAAAYPGDVVSELINLQLDYPEYIRSFSTVPVVIHYWSKNQIDFWNEVAPLGFYVSIDASGKFTMPLNIIEGRKSPPIFFYNAVVKIRRKIYTLTQMLSSAHDTGEIASWLSAWVESGASIPLGAVVDCALALLNSLCMIFNHYTYVENLDQNMNVLLGRSDVLPVCKIKRDRAHLIKAASVWTCFQGDDWVKKDFYLRIIGYSLEIQVLSEIDEVVTALFIVCQSEHQSSQYLESYGVLKNKISTFNHKEFYDVEKDNCQDCTHESCEILKEIDCPDEKGGEYEAMNECSAKGYILQLQLKADCLLKEDKAKDSTVPNPYHLPKICPNLINLYTQFSVWTNVMNPFYKFDPNKVSTSTGSEIYYRISRIDYGFSSPMSVKMFILEQKSIIDGATKLGRRLFKLFIEKLAEEEKKEQRKNESGIIVPLAPKKTFEEIIFDVANVMNGHRDYLEKCPEISILKNRNTSPNQCKMSEETNVVKTNSESEHFLNNRMKVFNDIESVAEINSDGDPFMKTRITIFCIDSSKYLILFKDYYFRISYLHLEKCTLSVEEIQTLRVPFFVNGNIIDVFMSIQLQKEWKDIVIIPTSQSIFMVGDQWEGNHGLDWPMYRFNCDFAKFIFIPYCYNYHWCLIILDMTKGTALHLDPLYSDAKKRHDYEKAFEHYIANCDKSNVLKKDWIWVENEVNLYKQLDGHNCGPIVMHYMNIFANLEDYIHGQTLQKFNPNEYRFDIVDLLLEWQDASNDICLYCYNIEKAHYGSGFKVCKMCNRWAHIFCIETNTTKLHFQDGKCEYCQPTQYSCFYCHMTDRSYCDKGFSKCKSCTRWAHNYCLIGNNTKFVDGRCKYCKL